MRTGHPSESLLTHTRMNDSNLIMSWLSSVWALVAIIDRGLLKCKSDSAL